MIEDGTLAHSLSNLTLNNNEGEDPSGFRAAVPLGFSSVLYDEVAKSDRVLEEFVSRMKEKVEQIKRLNRSGVERESENVQVLLQDLAEIRRKIATVQDNKDSRRLQKTGLERERSTVLTDCKNSLPRRVAGRFS